MYGLIWRKFCSGVHSENFHQSKCGVRAIIKISKFCGGVNSKNFLVSTYHLLNLSSDRNHCEILKNSSQNKYEFFSEFRL